MKELHEMNEAEKQQMRDYVKRWETLGPILEKIRADEIRKSDTFGALAVFDGLYEAAIRDRPPASYSGLIEQQAILKRGRQ
jgi:hypothetical protein